MSRTPKPPVAATAAAPSAAVAAPPKPRRGAASGMPEPASGPWAAPALDQPCALLGGLSPATFMRRHWHRKPLLIRQALPPQAWAGLDREALLALAARPGLSARLVERQPAAPAARGRRAAAQGEGWSLRQGPFSRRQLPPATQPGWTLLVQGLDRHLDAARALLDPFAFLPAARLDDLMVSWASEGGGVGPHVDSYDVFLLQIGGARRWRIAPPGDEQLRPGLPLRILEHFSPTEDWLLEPGDMLYLPPGWGHDGVAEGGPCLTASIGFRAPAQAELADALLNRMLDTVDPDDPAEAERYRDPGQPATAQPGRIPEALQAHALALVRERLAAPGAVCLALGEWLSEPAPDAEFAPGDEDDEAALDAQMAQALRLGLRLARGSRMLYDADCIYLNGQGWRAAGRDALLMQALADRRGLEAAALRRISAAARALLRQWLLDGWIEPLGPAA